MSQLLDNFVRSNNTLKKEYGAKYFERLSYPKMDVIQSDERSELKIICDIPGLSKDDINITIQEKPEIEGQVIEYLTKLTITGNKRELTESLNETDTFLVRELKGSAFTRSVFLHNDIVDIKKEPEVSLENGVLTIIFKLIDSKEIEEKKSQSIKTLKIK